MHGSDAAFLACSLHSVHDEEKAFEMELAWICDASGREFKRVPAELAAAAERQAKAALADSDMCMPCCKEGHACWLEPSKRGRRLPQSHAKALLARKPSTGEHSELVLAYPCEGLVTASMLLKGLRPYMRIGCSANPLLAQNPSCR